MKSKCFGKLSGFDPYLYVGTFPLPETERVEIGGAPEFMRGLRALFVSDVHLRASVSDERLKALTERIAAAGADMLLLGGDYGEGADQCARFFDGIGRLVFPMGIYAAAGNNDIDMPCVRPTVLLRNASVEVRRGGGVFEIGGCDEYVCGHPRTKDIFSDADRYRILLSHQPILPDCRADLILSGHTHGGQMSVFGVTPYTVGFEGKYPLRAVRGLHAFGETRMFVSNGVGVSRLPLRIGASPRISVLVFR